MIVARSISWRRVGRYVGWPMLAYFVWAALVSAAHELGFRRLEFPTLPISLLAATLGILLGFRNNSGYDRWWEARTLWGGVVNQSRTFARQVLTFLPGPEPADDDDDDDPAREARRAADRVVVRTPLLATAMAAAGGDDDVDVLPRRRLTDGAVRDPDGHAHGHHAGNGAGNGTGGHGAPHDAELAAFRRAAPGLLAGGTGAVDQAAAARMAAAADCPEPCHFEEVSSEARELVYAQIGFVNALRCHLRRQDPLPEVAPFFRPAVQAALRTEQNVPAAVLVWMATRLRRLLDGRRPDDAFRLAALDETLTELTNLMGGCERIKNTPIPRQYDFLPRVMVRAYLVVLPLGMVADLGPLTPLVTAVIAFLFLSLDQIGRNVEAPFENDIHDTPMSALCRTIEINLRQMLGETELPPPAQPAAGALY